MRVDRARLGDASTVTYTPSLPDDLTDTAAGDYFGRFDPSTPALPADAVYSNFQGSGFYGVQDTDSAGSGDVDLIELNWVGIDISNFELLSLSWFVAEDDSTDGNEDWDTTSSFRIAVQIDGGGFNDIFAIESEIGTDGNATNELPRVDTDFDTTGDGAEITPTFTQFSALIANGSTLDITATFEDLDTGDEDLAFDSLLLQGTAIPEPAGLVVGFGMLAMLMRRRTH
ncbi:MAG: hypothetical protein AAGD32_00465 [Planctomycetota bacterium]